MAAEGSVPANSWVNTNQVTATVLVPWQGTRHTHGNEHSLTQEALARESLL